MVTPFREAEHPRASSGEFTAKTNSDPESQLTAAEKPPVPPAVMRLLPSVSGTTHTDPDSGQTLFTTSHAELQEVLAAAYAAGDEIARRAVARSGRAIGQAIASATALVDLDVVAIGGGFSHVTPDIFDMIREPIAEHIQFGFVTKVRVVPSGLSGDGPLIGAAALIHRSELIAD